jgi:hypothetical protein
LDTNCGDPIVGSIQTNVESEVYDILACWGSPVGANGQIGISHACDNTDKKRQSSARLTTTVALSGPYAEREALLVAENYPSNATVDGVDARLDEATIDGADDDDGLSGGAIAGIVIGSLVAAALVLAAAFLIVTRQQLPESV